MKNLAMIATLFASLTFWGCNDESDPETDAHDHVEAEGLLLRTDEGEEVLRVYERVTDDTLVVLLDSTTEHLVVSFLDHDGVEFSLGHHDHDAEEGHDAEEEDKRLGFVVGDSSIVKVEHVDGAWEFQLTGLSAGSTTLEIQVLHVDHADFRTPALPVRVVAP